jgi:MoaA/NifB/PqqE/SkfB family radical SAM enzyme
MVTDDDAHTGGRQGMQLPFLNLDIEPTNRCNAHCYFCPRDATPHQGLMTPEVFDRALARAVEFDEIAQARFGARTKVNLCGLGEPLLNRHTPDFVRKVHEAGFEISVSSNGSLLDERRAAALLEGGLEAIEINVGEEGDDYAEIYGLPFEKTCDNVVRFAEMAGDKCQVRIVLVNHRRDPEHLAKMTSFWRERGIDHFLGFDVMNRGGTLFVDDMQYATFPERAAAEELLEARNVDPVCGAPFVLLFIGYDGQYYLCCSDWKKEVAFGSVFETSFMAIMGDKLEHAASRMPICKNCNHDPVNRLTDALRARQSGERDDAAIDRLLEELIEQDTTSRAIVRELADFKPAARPGRRLIQVIAEADGAH